jgi:hypothetical protein
LEHLVLYPSVVFVAVWGLSHSALRVTADDSVQGTVITITSTPIGSGYIYAYNTYLSNLSTFTKLNFDNLNATSTTIFGNINLLSTNSILSINNLNTTSTTTFNHLNSLSTNPILSNNNLNNTSTSIVNNINS